MKLVESADAIKVVFDAERQKALLDAASSWVDEKHTFELYEVAKSLDHNQGEDVTIVAPHKDIPLTEYLPLIGDYRQLRQHASSAKIEKHGDTTLTVRTGELEDGTDLFGFTTNFGRYAYPAERRLAIVPSIAMLTGHVDGNASLVIRNRAFGERAWLEVDKNTRLIKGADHEAVELGGLRVASDREIDLVTAADTAAQVVLGLEQAVKDELSSRRAALAERV